MSPRQIVVALICLLLAAAVALVASAGWQRRERVDAACARIFEEDKTRLGGYRWSWLPPGWTCEFRDGTRGSYEKRLPFGQR